MLRFIPLPLLLVILLLAEGTSSGQVAEKDFENRSQLALLAWNEDLVNSYQFAVLRDGNFEYTITEKDDSKNTKRYYGKCDSYYSDTLFLKYKKNASPPGLMSYLIREADNHYLIQHFINSPKPMFLRFQQVGPRF